MPKLVEVTQKKLQNFERLYCGSEKKCRTQSSNYECTTHAIQMHCHCSNRENTDISNLNFEPTDSI